MQQWYKCPMCSQEILYGVNPCPYCKCSLAWSQQGPVLYLPPTGDPQQIATTNIPNISRQGNLANSDIPEEIRHWNWGAFFLTWIWGIGNSVWWSFLTFIPYLGIVVMPFVLGAKGNQWAWKSKSWESTEHFQKTQKTWAKWGIAIFCINIFFVLLAIIILNTTKYVSSGRTEMLATERANIQTAVAAYMYDHNGAVPSGPFIAGTRGGDLSPFLLDNLNCTYVIDAKGIVTSQTGCLK